MPHFVNKLLASVVFAAATPGLKAQALTILLSDSPSISSVPGAPTGTGVSASDEFLSEDGDSVRASVSPFSGTRDPSIYRNGALTTFARIGSTGALGPNRSGSEAGHVFLEFFAAQDVSRNQVVFLGKAGPAGSASSSQPFAIWRNRDGQNLEIARSGVDTALGPNLGAGWRFGSTGTPAFQFNQMATGDVLIDTQVLTPADAARSALILHRPGIGNTPCLVAGQTGPLGPNLADASATFGGGSYTPSVGGTRVLINASAFGATTQEGIWRVCDGAPRALALSRETGVLGPGTGSGGVFDTIRTSPRPLGTAGFVFGASYRATAQASLADGLFLHDGSSSQLIIAEGVTGASGPSYQNAVFEDLNLASYATAGETLVVRASIRKTDNTSRTGLWRLRHAGVPEAIAIQGEIGSVAPPAGIFSLIQAWTVYPNGDVLAQCTVSNGPSGLYRFVPGRPAQLLLSIGQTVSVPTPQGVASATVLGYSLVPDSLGSAGPSSHSAGYDSWTSRKGAILLRLQLSTSVNSNIRVLALMQVSDQELLLRDGFESSAGP